MLRPSEISYLFHINRLHVLSSSSFQKKQHGTRGAMVAHQTSNLVVAGSSPVGCGDSFMLLLCFLSSAPALGMSLGSIGSSGGPMFAEKYVFFFWGDFHVLDQDSNPCVGNFLFMLLLCFLSSAPPALGMSFGPIGSSSSKFKLDFAAPPLCASALPFFVAHR